jgi:glycosyltransferase involved in cell wall biosynthesis
MKLSVVIPCYNGAPTLGAQLEAVCSQPWPDGFEVIVVDNRSTDDSVAVVAKYQERFPCIRLVTANDGKGCGYARNCGVRQSTGDAVLFCDADDEVAPGWIAAMGEALRQHDFVASRVELEKLNDVRVIANQGHAQTRGLQRIPYPPYLPHAGGGTVGIKRWLHDSVGGFDETFIFVQDTHYCLRIQLAGHELHFVPAAVIHLRMRDRGGALFRQARGWGQYSVRLYRESRRLGTERLAHPWRLGFEAWRNLLFALPSVRSAQARKTWLFQLGYRMGRLVGSIRYRTLAP